MADNKTIKTILALILAGAAAVGLAFALKKKAPIGDFDAEINEMIES